MNTEMYGYVRVSTKEQNEQRQLLAMDEYGVRRERIIIEKESGKSFDRPLYRKLVRRLRTGDVLVVKSIDRLGRNYTEILEEWRLLTRDRGAHIVVLDMPLLDTRKQNDLTGALISDIVLQLLSYVAETERENIRKRQAEGIAAAKAMGVRFGRPRRPLPDDFAETIHKWRSGELSVHETTAQLSVSRSYLYKLFKEMNKTTT